MFANLCSVCLPLFGRLALALFCLCSTQLQACVLAFLFVFQLCSSRLATSISVMPSFAGKARMQTPCTCPVQADGSRSPGLGLASQVDCSGPATVAASLGPVGSSLFGLIGLPVPLTFGHSHTIHLYLVGLFGCLASPLGLEKLGPYSPPRSWHTYCRSVAPAGDNCRPR